MRVPVLTAQQWSDRVQSVFVNVQRTDPEANKETVYEICPHFNLCDNFCFTAGFLREFMLTNIDLTLPDHNM